MTKALISIDYTEDFVADSGKLTAGAPAQAISGHQQGNSISF
ncbi:amidases related to nicotinamidase [Streptococcus pneumoniae]|nr:amidases related to nicotinamidase [Streptococcus pneumoniae]